jgi:hypothetical protein
MQSDEILAWVKAERLSLADFLDDLDDHEWQADSLCAGWTVRDVAAHLTLSTRTTLLVTIRGAIRARGDFNRMVANLGSRRPSGHVWRHGSQAHHGGCYDLTPALIVRVSAPCHAHVKPYWRGPEDSMDRPLEADPSAELKRRLGKSALELGDTNATAGSPDIWELENGDIAVIGRDLTAAYAGRLPEGVGIVDDERLVVIPRNMLVAAKPDIPDA